MRLGIQIAAMTGISGVDVCDLLRDGGRFEQRGSHLWFLGLRSKSAMRITVPLAPWLAERLKPYRHEERGLVMPVPVSKIETWGHHWGRVERALSIPHIEGQGIKRLRATFNVLIENEIGVPVAVCKALLAHKIKGKDAHGAYTKPTDEQMVKAVAAFEGLVFPSECDGPVAARFAKGKSERPFGST